MPEVRQVLQSADTRERDSVIAAHLSWMEAALERTRTIVASLRGLLTAAGGLGVECRGVTRPGGSLGHSPGAAQRHLSVVRRTFPAP